MYPALYSFVNAQAGPMHVTAFLKHVSPRTICLVPEPHRVLKHASKKLFIPECAVRCSDSYPHPSLSGPIANAHKYFTHVRSPHGQTSRSTR